jgi:hypothetical protein
MEARKSSVLKILALVAFLAVVAVNALSVLLPLNGLTPSDVSDLYPTLLTPAGLTFSVWGAIYILLACYTAWQLLSKTAPKAFVYRINLLFSISSAANILWVFAWHYKLIPLTMLLILSLLGCLIVVLRLIMAQELTLIERIFIKLPFTIYLGWITVATVANATVLLISLGVTGFGAFSENLTIVTLAAGTILGMWAGIRIRSAAYLLVMIWAYTGTLIKHVSAVGFGMRYPRIVWASAACIAMLAAATVGLVIMKFRGRKEMPSAPQKQ